MITHAYSALDCLPKVLSEDHQEPSYVKCIVELKSNQSSVNTAVLAVNVGKSCEGLRLFLVKRKNGFFIANAIRD